MTVEAGKLDFAATGNYDDNGKVGAFVSGLLTVNSGAKLAVSQGSLTLEGGLSGTLSELTLGSNAKMEISKASTFTIAGASSWGWESGTQLTLGKGVKITLGQDFSFADGVSGSIIYPDYLVDPEAGRRISSGTVALLGMQHGKITSHSMSQTTRRAPTTTCTLMRAVSSRGRRTPPQRRRGKKLTPLSHGSRIATRTATSGR